LNRRFGLLEKNSVPVKGADFLTPSACDSSATIFSTVSRGLTNPHWCSGQTRWRFDTLSVQLVDNGIANELRTVPIVQFLDSRIYVVDELLPHRNRYQLLTECSFAWHGGFLSDFP
jgi:hypothetical protein